MPERKPPQRLTFARSVLWILLLGAFALGILADRGILLVTGGLKDDADGPVYAIDARTSRELTRLRDQVSAIAERAIDSGDAEAVSVYFQDIASGSWFGIDEDEPFSPPHLLKLPVMLAWLKRAETSPPVLKQLVPFRLPPGTARRVTATRKLVPGRSYAVEDLLYRMVVYDDEEAFTVLSAALPAGALTGVYEALDIPSAPDDDEDMLTLEQYAHFFRALSGTGYLNRAMAEKALSYLSRSAFRDGIVAGVPPHVPVASRSGIRTVQVEEYGEEGPDRIQFHEIGLVSAPRRPYLIGLKARGTDLGRLTRAVRDIARMAYKELEQQQEKAP